MKLCWVSVLVRKAIGVFESLLCKCFKLLLNLKDLTRTFYEKVPPTSFSPAISPNAGISHLNFLTFSFNYFAMLRQNFKAIWRTSLKLLYKNQDHTPIKEKNNFLAKSLWNWSFNEFSHRMTIAANQFESHDKVLDVMDKNCYIVTSKHNYLKEAWSGQFLIS